MPSTADYERDPHVASSVEKLFLYAVDEIYRTGCSTHAPIAGRWRLNGSWTDGVTGRWRGATEFTYLRMTDSLSIDDGAVGVRQLPTLTASVWLGTSAALCWTRGGVTGARPWTCYCTASS